MNIELLPIRIIQLRNEVDRFGFSSLLALRFGFKNAPRSFACYLHGWIWRRDLKIEDLGYYFTPRNTPIVVTKEHQKDVLTKHGFSRVIIGALPFAYVKKSSVVRKIGTLLVMPPHSLQYLGYEVISAKMLGYIDDISSEFSEICICLHADDFSDKVLTSMLDSKKITYILGAHSADANSLLRMRQIFDYFEYVTTTTFGSHIVYAAFCGCKVSLLTDYFLMTPLSAFTNEPQLKLIPGYLERSIDILNNKQNLNDQFPWLFLKHPKLAIQKVDWATKEIGVDNLLDKGQLMEFLGWTALSKMRAMSRIAFRRFSELFQKTPL